MSLRPTPTKIAPLAADQATALTHDGYLMLRDPCPKPAGRLRCRHRHRRPMGGATRAVPRALDYGESDEASSLITADDILVFDADVPHVATRNRSGARWRSLLLNFVPERMQQVQDSCRAIRNVRIDTSETFIP